MKTSHLLISMASMLPAIGAQAQLTWSFESPFVNDVTADGWTRYQQTGAASVREILDPTTIPADSKPRAFGASDGTNVLAYTPFGDRDGFGANQWSSIVRSPVFTYNGSGDITVDLRGGRTVANPDASNPEMDNLSTAQNTFPLNPGQLRGERDVREAGGWVTSQGVALRDALTGDYVAWVAKEVINPYTDNSDGPFSTSEWVTEGFDQATMQALTSANPNRKFEIDVYDSFGAGWGWQAVDNIVVPGTAAGFYGGDANDDGMVNSLDAGAVIGNWTGTRSDLPFEKDGVNNTTDPTDTYARARNTGDFNGDGDVNSLDAGQVIGNFGTSAVSSRLALVNDDRADLLYDPTTGEVTLDASEAAGAVITYFALQNAAGGDDFNTGVANFPFGILTDDTATLIGDTDFARVGFSGLHELGAIMPLGLSQSELENFLTTFEYTGAAGSGIMAFDVVALPVPEPASLALLGLSGLVMLGGRRRSA